MSLNWNFQRGGVFKPKKPSVGGVWLFSGTTQFAINDKRLLFQRGSTLKGLFGKLIDSWDDQNRANVKQWRLCDSGHYQGCNNIVFLNMKL